VGEFGRQVTNRSFKYTNFTADKEAEGPIKRGRTSYSSIPPSC